MDDILPKKQVLSTQQTAREGPAFLLSLILSLLSVILLRADRPILIPADDSGLYTYSPKSRAAVFIISRIGR